MKTSTADLFARAIWMNKTAHTVQYEAAFQYLVGTDYSLLSLHYADNILTITTKDADSKRNTFVDLYYFDMFTVLNRTIDVEIELEILNKFPLVSPEGSSEQAAINSNIRQSARRYQMFNVMNQACYVHPEEFENSDANAKRISACLELKKQYLTYEVKIRHIKRMNFKLNENEFLLRSEIVNGDFGKGSETQGLKPETRDKAKDYLRIKFVTLSVHKNIFSEYKIKVSIDLLRVNFNFYNPRTVQDLASRQTKITSHLAPEI